MSEHHPPDWKAREQALDTQRSFIVEAPAGSGKTGLLIQRYLKLLTADNVERPEQVLAITFTVKATAEMRKRILEELEAAARDAPFKNGEVFERTTRDLAKAILDRNLDARWNILAQPGLLNIRTIDSLCASIAACLPILSGASGNLQPVEDSNELYIEAAERTLKELDSTGTGTVEIRDALTTLLLHRDGNLENCQKLIAEMLGKRDQWARLLPECEEFNEAHLDRVVRPHMEAVLRDRVTDALRHLTTFFKTQELDELAALAHIASHNLRTENRKSQIEICLGISTSPSAVPEDLAHWRALASILLTEGRLRKSYTAVQGFPAKTAEAVRFGLFLNLISKRDGVEEALAAVSNLPPIAYTEDEWHVTKALFHLLRRSMAHLEVVFVERGQCDFTKISLAAIHALKQEGGSSDLAAAFGMKFQHLLVDEMQDTSISQFILLKQITSGWDGHGQTVFLVGDPRQSIYLFREARVEQFVRTIREQRFGNLPLEHLQLTANFRSHSALVEQFNRSFERVRPDITDETTAGEFVPAVSARRQIAFAPDDYKPQQWHILPAPNDDAPQNHLLVRQATEIHGIVARVWQQDKDAGRNPSRIAVLGRARSHLLHIAHLFREHRIPYRTLKVDALGQQQEVLDALSLLRALLHPADRVAWLAVLRAPWCGLSLRDLHILCGSDDEIQAEHCMEELFVANKEKLSPDGQQRLKRIVQILAAANQQRGRLTISHWVERTWHSLGAPLYLDELQQENVLAFFHVLDEMELNGDTVDAALLKEHLDDLYSTSPMAGENVVDLLTVHGAKGLEWDVVIVPSLEKTSRRSSGSLLAWMELPGAQAEDGTSESIALLAPIPRKGNKEPGLHKYIIQLQKQREHIELKRLFYVASTRAREGLHLFASLKPNQKVPSDGTLLKAAWEAAQAYFPAPGNLAEMPGKVLDIAASGDTEVEETTAKHTPIRRFPSSFDIAVHLAASLSSPNWQKAVARKEKETRRFTRPEGSLAARAIGNAVHLFVESLAKRIASGTSPQALQSEVQQWGPRIAAVLRSLGLGPTDVRTHSADVERALSNMLDDETGRWLLSFQSGACSEEALATVIGEGFTGYRLDRIFYAGEAPLSTGNEWLWIVDFKATDYRGAGVESFLDAEVQKYCAQMENYAQLKRSELGPEVRIQLALYYPMLKKLRSWPYNV